MRGLVPAPQGGSEQGEEPAAMRAGVPGGEGNPQGGHTCPARFTQGCISPTSLPWGLLGPQGPGTVRGEREADPTPRQKWDGQGPG